MTRLRIGWIGIGRMGEAMVRRLARAGYSVSLSPQVSRGPAAGMLTSLPRQAC